MPPFPPPLLPPPGDVSPCRLRLRGVQAPASWPAQCGGGAVPRQRPRPAGRSLEPGHGGIPGDSEERLQGELIRWEEESGQFLDQFPAPFYHCGVMEALNEENACMFLCFHVNSKHESTKIFV